MKMLCSSEIVEFPLQYHQDHGGRQEQGGQALHHGRRRQARRLGPKEPREATQGTQTLSERQGADINRVREIFPQA